MSRNAVTNDTTFDLTKVSANVIGGYDRATRIALKNDALVKVKEAAVKKVLPTLLSSTIQVTTFDPSEMKESTNFFNFVSSWRTDSAILRQHAVSYYMHNVFNIVKVSRAEAVDATTGTPILDANGNPTYTYTVVQVGDLFELWPHLTLKEVFDSCKTIARHAEDVDRQNLQWTWELILANVDADLRHYIMSECDAFGPEGATGPMAFYVAAKKIITSTSNLAHNVISGVMVLELRHFDGEDVGQCVFVLRNVLKFLNYGHPTFNKTPPTIMEYLVDVFLRCSNYQFKTYIQNLRDFHPRDVDTPEKLFAKAQLYYNDLITKPGNVWLPIRKKRAVFTAASDNQVPHLGKPPSMSPPSIAPVRGPRQEVDRTPPKAGEPTTRINKFTKREEHFCFKCPNGGRWGNHDSDGHDQWYADFKAFKDRQMRQTPTSPVTTPQTQAPAPTPTSEQPASMRRTTQSANFLAPVSNVLRRAYVSFQDSDDESF